MMNVGGKREGVSRRARSSASAGQETKKKRGSSEINEIPAREKILIVADLGESGLLDR
jgi:hypothetical protein